MRHLEASARDSRRLVKFTLFAAAAGLLASGPAWIQCRRDTALIPAIAPGMHGVGFAVLCASIAVAIISFAALLYSIATAHRSVSVRKHGPFTETLWTLIPVAIVIAAAAPALHALAAHTSSPGVTYKCEMRVEQ